MRKFIAEFKKFINRGNALELAVGVVVGGAFTTIVNSLVNDIITPVIGRFVGGIDLSGIKIPLGGDSYILIGSFVQKILDFILTAFVLFLIIRSVNKANEITHIHKHEIIKKEDPEDIKLLKSINNELKRINKKTSK